MTPPLKREGPPNYAKKAYTEEERKLWRKQWVVDWPETSDRCQSGRDGECYWHACPQERDGEPSKSGRHCPLDFIDPEE